MNLDYVYLQTKINEYLLTLDSTRRDEWYTTARNFAACELSNFMAWLQDNND